jgi:hypothetical protein
MKQPGAWARANNWVIQKLYLSLGVDWQAETANPQRWATQPTNTPLDVLEENTEVLEPCDCDHTETFCTQNQAPQQPPPGSAG